MTTQEVSASVDSIAKISLHGDRPKPTLKNGALGVFRYELMRSLTPLRILLWVGLLLFPVLLVSFVRLVMTRAGASPDDFLALTIVLFILLPEVITILCMLLWATPIVNAELESQTWVYSVVRPKARWALITGKYLVAVAWTASCTSLSATLAVPIVGMTGAFKIWLTLSCLCWLSAICYGALFMLIGTLIQRRAMVVAFGYTILVEFILATIPAVINRFTISFRLWSILYNSIDIPPQLLDANFMIQDSSTIGNVAVLLAASVFLLSIAVWRIQKSQFRWQSEV
jgi:ABC-type transport system involved in multi-copper enzyme maturation permease subunit